MSRELIPREEGAGSSDYHAASQWAGRETSYRSRSGDYIRHEGREFPSFEEAWRGRLETDPVLLSRMPWMRPRAVCDEGLVRQYLSGGVLPCGTPFEAVLSYDWRNRIALPDSELNTRRFRGVTAAREGMARQVSARHRRFHLPLRAIPANYGVDAYAYRTLGEVEYVDNLLELHIREWEGRRAVDATLLCWQRPILRAEFRYAPKPRMFWEWTYWERRMRARTGLLIPYQCIEAECILTELRYRRWPRVPSAFAAVEMSPGCRAELPSIVTYKGSELAHDPNSGYWTQFFTEWPARVAVWVLWDLYDSYRLWYVPSRLRADMRALALGHVLASRANEAELHRLLTTIESIDWRGAVFRHTKPTDTAYDDPNRPAPGDFVWYDPWKQERLDSFEVAQARLREKPSMPADQRRGYVHLDEEEIAEVGGDAGVGGMALGSEGGQAGNLPEVVTTVPPPSRTGRTIGENGFGPLIRTFRGTDAVDLGVPQNLSTVRIFLRDCGIDPNEMPRGRTEFVAWFAEYLRPRPRTVLCASCQDRLCETCFRGYDNNDPARLTDVMEVEGPVAPGSGELQLSAEVQGREGADASF